VTAPIPAAEIISNRVYGGCATVRVICTGCQRTHLHRMPTDASTPVVAPCGAVYTIGAR
jgi:hypothetical protein